MFRLEICVPNLKGLGSIIYRSEDEVPLIRCIRQMSSSLNNGPFAGIP